MLCLQVCFIDRIGMSGNGQQYFKHRPASAGMANDLSLDFIDQVMHDAEAESPATGTLGAVHG